MLTQSIVKCGKKDKGDIEDQTVTIKEVVWSSEEKGLRTQMSRQTNGTAYCNWVAFSKAVHDTLKEVPTIAADGLEVTNSDFRWEYTA